MVRREMPRDLTLRGDVRHDAEEGPRIVAHRLQFRDDHAVATGEDRRVVHHHDHMPDVQGSTSGTR